MRNLVQNLSDSQWIKENNHKGKKKPIFSILHYLHSKMQTRPRWRLLKTIFPHLQPFSRRATNTCKLFVLLANIVCLSQTLLHLTVHNAKRSWMAQLLWNWKSWKTKEPLALTLATFLRWCPMAKLALPVRREGMPILYHLQESRMRQEPATATCEV